MRRVGFEGKLYWGTAGTTAATELVIAKDVSYKFDPSLADVSDRESIIEYSRTAMVKFTLEFECNNNDSNTFIAAVRAAAAAGTAMAFKTRDRTSGWGCDGDFSIGLYLIISSKQDGDKNALDYFSDSELGDTDGDGMREILDAWGQPIEFLRWAPGYAEQVGPDGQWGVANADDNGNGVTDDILEAGWSGSDDVSPITTQTRHYNISPDPFDPVKQDPRWANANVTFKPYALRPLVFSAGRDKGYDVAQHMDDTRDSPFHYTLTTIPNDPYATPEGPPFTPPDIDPYLKKTQPPQRQLGTVFDADDNGREEWGDNITNHYPGQ